MFELNFSQKNSEAILFIDTETSVLDNIYSLFPIEHKVHTAKTLDAAWRILRTQKIDCIFCNVNLANENGIELLKICKANGINIPFILISKDSVQKRSLLAQKHQVADVVYKPLNQISMNRRLKSYFPLAK